MVFKKIEKVIMVIKLIKVIRKNQFPNSLITLITLALFVSCENDDKTIEHKRVFRFNLYSEVSSLDPAFARNQSNTWSVNQLFDGLVQINDKLKIVSSIAKKWKISEDGLTYTFHLRTDVFFHNSKVFQDEKGRKVVADDFVYSFHRIIDHSVASPGAWIFNDKIDTAQAFTAINDSTFQIKLRKSFPPFMGLLTTQYCVVVPKEAVEFYKTDFSRNPVGTGPFKFKIWQQGIMMGLVKNENYFETDKEGNRLPYLDAVQISFIDNRSAEFLKFTNGEFDFVSSIDGSFKDEVLTFDGKLQPKFKDKIKLYRMSYLHLAYLGILMDENNPALKNSPLRIKAIRKAINYGFDREKMMKYLFNNIGLPATAGIIPPGLPAFDNAAGNGYFYSPEKVAQYLKEAGFPNGKGLPPIKLFFQSTFTNHVAYVQSQLAALGIKVKLEMLAPAFLREAMSKYQAPFFSGTWIADYPDEENFLALFYSKNPAPPNYTKFSNAEFDKLYELALAEKNEKKRIQYYQKMDNIVMEEAPVVPLYYDEVVRFAHDYVEGIEPNPINMLILKKVRFTDMGVSEPMEITK